MHMLSHQVGGAQWEATAQRTTPRTVASLRVTSVSGEAC